jgi:hypothetical protein
MVVDTVTGVLAVKLPVHATTATVCTILAVPAAIAVTTPVAASTVVTAGLLLLHVPPDTVLVNGAAVPGHIIAGPETV